MEDDLEASSINVELKQSEKENVVELGSGEEEASFDGEFVKVEKESLDEKESSNLLTSTDESAVSLNAGEFESANSASNLNLPLEGKDKEFQLQAKTVNLELELLNTKESLDVKESSNLLEPTVETTVSSDAREFGSAHSASDINLTLEAEDNELELQSETIDSQIKVLDLKEPLEVRESSSLFETTVQSTESSNAGELGSPNSASYINLPLEAADKELEFQLESINPELRVLDSKESIDKKENSNLLETTTELTAISNAGNVGPTNSTSGSNMPLEVEDKDLEFQLKTLNPEIKGLDSKDSLDVKESSDLLKSTGSSNAEELRSENSASVINLPQETEDKEIEFQLETANPELKYSEDMLLRLEVEVTNDEKINNEFELGKEVFNDQIIGAEQSRKFDLEEFNALLSDGMKQQNNININEAFNACQCNEQKIPMKNIKEIETELAMPAGVVHSVEELYKPIATQEELESIRTVGLEVEVTNDRLEKINNEFKLEKQVLNDQTSEAEQSHNFYLEELDAFLSDHKKQQIIVNINKAFNVSWCDEQKMPVGNIKEIDAELVKSAGDVHSVEELYKSIGTQEELESIRAMGQEIEVTNDGLEKIDNEFKLKEVLNDQIPEAKQNRNFDLEELDAWLYDIKQQNIVDINEAFNVGWFDERKMPMENIKEIEEELAMPNGDVHSVEELYKPISAQEELESITAMGSDKLEIDKVNAKKMEDEMIKLGNEQTEVHVKVEENNEAITHAESRDLSSKTQVRSQKNLLSFSKEDLNAKLMYLDEIERHLKEYCIQGTVEDLNVKLLLKEEYCIQLEAKLHWTNKNLAKTESLLQGVLSSKHELEQELAEKGAERQKLEDLTMIQGKCLSEYKNLVSGLQNEVKSLRAKFEAAEEKQEPSGVRKKELHEKLRYARDALEQQLKATEEASTRYLDIKILHETSTKNLELELEEAHKNFKQKVYEAEELQEKLKSLEDHIDYFKGQAIETAQRFTSLKTEMESNATKVFSFVHNIEDIKQKASNDAKFQRELKEKKDLEREALLKQSRAELKAKHQYARVLEKQVEGLEKKLQEAESQYEVKATKQSEELSLVNEEVNELREKFSQTSEIKKKILELEDKLKPAFTSREEASSTKANNENIESEIKEVKSRFLDITKMLERKKAKGKALETSPHKSSHVSVKPFCRKSLRIILVLAVITLIVGVILQMIHHYD